MFKFEKKQEVFDIYGVKIGGQPGEYPTALAGTIFYAGHNILSDENKGVFDKQKAESLLNEMDEMADLTGNPAIVQIFGSTPEALLKYIDFVSETSDSPFLIDSTAAEARIAGSGYVTEIGLSERTIYNSINMSIDDEEIEALTVVDILRRADIEIDMVSITGNKKVPGAHGITTYCDKLIENTDFEKADMIVLPGGMPGTLNLGLCEPLMDQIHGFNTSKKGLAAICAAPTVFGKAGLLEGKKATCYPGMEGDLLGANVSTDSVCHDGHIITSRGMGTAIPFALEIVKTFKGEDVANKLAQAIVYNN